MKILFVIPSLAKGGQEKAGMQVCNYLARQHELKVLCFSPQEDFEYPYQCPITRVVPPTTGGRFSKISTAFYRIRRMKEIKNDWKPDISIGFGNTAIIFNQLANVGEKLIASVRQSFHMLMKDPGLSLKAHLYLYVRALRAADSIVPVSNAINDELRHYFQLDNHSFVNNGVDVDAIRADIRDHRQSLPAAKRWITHVGRFDQSKGQWHLVKIFVELKKQFPDLGLIFMGAADASTGNGKAILDFCKAHLLEHGLTYSDNISEDADVIFAGHQANPVRIIASSHLFIFPSLWEGFPNALVEAMACGVPVVAADCATGPKEILQSIGEQYGLLLRSFDDSLTLSGELTENEKEWIHSIVALLGDANRLAFYKERSLARARYFSIEKMGNEWLRLVNSLKITNFPSSIKE